LPNVEDGEGLLVAFVANDTGFALGLEAREKPLIATFGVEASEGSIGLSLLGDMMSTL